MKLDYFKERALLYNKLYGMNLSLYNKLYGKDIQPNDKSSENLTGTYITIANAFMLIPFLVVSITVLIIGTIILSEVIK